MIHFDLEDRYADELVVGSAISRREGVVLSVVVHVLLVLAIVFLPQLALFQESPEELEQRRQEELARQRQDSPRFVFVDPQFDLKALRPPERADLSDLDRRAQAREKAPVPVNPEPFSRGNSAERTESADAARARGPESPQPPNPAPPQPQPEEQIARTLPPGDEGLPRHAESTPRASGALGEALKNLQKYVQNQTFNNPQGGANDPGAQIQFDSKGVEFGPWLRRFVAQVKRNWNVPYAAMTFKGHVVLQFNVHRDGRISDVTVFQPSDIQAFNVAAYNAILGSSPTVPLPPDYPEDKAFFTVTFYYNESPN